MLKAPELGYGTIRGLSHLATSQDHITLFVKRRKAMDRIPNKFQLRIAVVLMFLGILVVDAFGFNMEWLDSFRTPGSNQTIGNAITSDDTDHVYVTGMDDETIFTAKYDPSGNLLWNKSFNNPIYSPNFIIEGKAIAVDQSGSVYVVGTMWDRTLYSTNRSYMSWACHVYKTMPNNIIIIQYASDGTQMGFDVWGGWLLFGNDEAVGVAVDNYGFVYIAGFTYMGPPEEYDYLLIKYDDHLNYIGETTFNSSFNGDDILRAFTIDPKWPVSVDIFLTGKSWNGTNYDFLTIKYTEDLDLQWKVRYNRYPGSNDEPTDMVIDSNKNVTITGWSQDGIFMSTSDYLTIKYDSAGSLLWDTMYDGPYSAKDEARAIAVDVHDNVYITGHSDSLKGASTRLPYSTYDCTTIKYDHNGNELWVARFSRGPTTNNYGEDIAVDDQGNAYISGFISSPYHDDYLILKYDTSGNQIDELTHGQNTTSDRAKAITIDNGMNVYVTGSTGEDSTHWFEWYCTTIKLNP